MKRLEDKIGSIYGDMAEEILDIYLKEGWLAVNLCRSCIDLPTDIIFSVGFKEEHKKQDIAIVGLHPKIAYEFLYNFYKNPDSIKENTYLKGLTSGDYRTILVQANYKFKDICRYDTDDELLVMIPCDKNGLFAWEDGSEMKELFDILNDVVEVDLYSKEFGESING